MVDPFEKVISRWATSRQNFSREDVSPYHRVNGYPPTGQEYQAMAADDFRDYRLSVGGLVAHPASLSLDELRALGEQRQVTKHNCIQGWTAVAEWARRPAGAADRGGPTGSDGTPHRVLRDGRQGPDRGRGTLRVLLRHHPDPSGRTTRRPSWRWT